MRLTKRNADGIACSAKPFEISTFDMVDKLAAYEDAEEQGRLVVLPCKVGDVLFVTDQRTIHPACRKVESITWWNGAIFIRAIDSRRGGTYRCRGEDFGKTVFLTREEAEAAMGKDR